MTQRDAAFLGCRLMAVWFFIIGGIQLPIAIIMRLSMQESFGKERPPASFLQSMFETSVIATPALQLVAAAILFYGAGWLSRLLSADPDAEGSIPKGKGLFGVGALLIGLYVASQYLPGVFSSIYDRFTADPGSPVRADTLVPNLIGILLAGGLLAWAILQSRRTGLADGQDPE